MANVLKKAVFGLMEKAFLQEGFVLAVRKWNPHTMVEIDLHLPETDLSKWQTIQRLKCKVSDFEFRDYTPAHWNVESRTCTLYIETAHQGHGSHWASSLQAGDTVSFGPAHAAQLPGKPGKILCVADGSALGHFLALKQLIHPQNHPLEACIVLEEEYTIPEELLKSNPEFQWLKSAPADRLELLCQQLQHKSMQNYSTVLIAGNIPMVTGLRKFLKKNPYLTASVVAHGFWK